MPRRLSPLPTDPLEREWQSTVIEIADIGGWWHYHTYNSRRSTKGFPDLVLVRDSVIFAELKRSTGRVRPEQVEWMEQLAQAGAEVYLWRPRDIEEVRATLLRPRRALANARGVVM